MNPYLAVGLQNNIIVFEVFGVTIEEQMELDCLSFAFLLRDALCYKLQQTEDGRDFLDKCWRYQQTEPDLKALREQFK